MIIKLPEENLDIRDDFLLQHGKRVHEVKEVKVGDILGIAFPKEIYVKLNYVDSVSYESSFLKFNDFPYAKLKNPFFGFPISDEGVPTGSFFLQINPGSSGRMWMPLVISQELSPEQQEIQRRDLEEEFEGERLIEDKKERVYVMNKGAYKDLGNLIPLVELPSFSFLPQSRNLDELVGMVEESKANINSARTAYESLRKIFKIPF